MVQLAPNLPDDAWKFALEVCDVTPNDSNAEARVRKTLIYFIREAMVDFINKKAEEKGIKKRLIITGKSHNKIILIDTEKI